MIELTFPITFDKLNYLEYHLRNGLEFSDAGDCETIENFSMHLVDDLYLELKVVNAKTEDGGAYVDPVIMKKTTRERFSCFYDYLIMDVLDSLTTFEFEFDEVTYRVSPEVLETLDK
jgi:hypothetical protein